MWQSAAQRTFKKTIVETKEEKYVALVSEVKIQKQAKKVPITSVGTPTKWIIPRRTVEGTESPIFEGNSVQF